jgi:exodeoxyribonuclease VII large subunit
MIWGMSGAGFFEFQERMTKRGKAANARADAVAEEAMTITQLTAKIDRALKAGVPGAVTVKGEVSNFRPNNASGHYYFTMKDAGACIPCVMWRSDAQRLKFTLQDGVECLAGGTVSVFAQQGKYQLYVTSLRPIGQGALELAFQQLRAKLEGEGLFAAERKRVVPAYPLRIALVTSRATAALQDMLKVLRRYAWLRLSVYHVPVQGDGAAEKIAAAIGHLNEQLSVRETDVILLSRGGGSLEDLWEFNEEVVARAIAASSIAVVTGIGHEVDVSIADLVADHHAHTPTEAAQTIVQGWKAARESIDVTAVRLGREVAGVVGDGLRRLNEARRHEVFRRPLFRVNQARQLLDDQQRSLWFAMRERVGQQGRKLEACERRLNEQRPAMMFMQARQQLNELQQRLVGAGRRTIRSRMEMLQRLVMKLGEAHPQHQIRLQSARLEAMATATRRWITSNLRERKLELHGMQAALEALGPLNVLRRGYSVTMLKKGREVVRSAAQVQPGDRLVTQFGDGSIESVVEDGKQLSLFD